LSRQISARPATRNDVRARGPMTFESSPMAGYSARELLLAAAARAVLAALREPLGQKRLSPSADARLQLLETALEPYPSANLDPAGK
jgi:hypothetical protein